MACTSVIARHFPDRLRARGSALYATLGYGVPGVLGGLGGGWVSDAFGLGATFVCAALVALAAAVCCAIAARADNAIAAS
jgi:PPP family 3-phenylpropionic acid transporter